MEKLDLSYEEYGSGYIIADYSDDSNVRYCGEDFEWNSQPIVDDPFLSKREAEIAATLYFTGENLVS